MHAVHSGVLYKRGGVFSSRWTPNIFAVFSPSPRWPEPLLRFKRTARDQWAGQVVLSGATAGRLPATDGGCTSALYVHTLSGKTYILAAESEAEAERWLAAIAGVTRPVASEPPPATPRATPPTRRSAEETAAAAAQQEHLVEAAAGEEELAEDRASSWRDDELRALSAALAEARAEARRQRERADAADARAGLLFQELAARRATILSLSQLPPPRVGDAAFSDAAASAGGPGGVAESSGVAQSSVGLTGRTPPSDLFAPWFFGSLWGGPPAREAAPTLASSNSSSALE